MPGTRARPSIRDDAINNLKMSRLFNILSLLQDEQAFTAICLKALCSDSDVDARDREPISFVSNAENTAKIKYN